MEEQLVALTAVGEDRPGIVAGVTGALYELGCNLEDATSTILRGHFAMMLIVKVPADKVPTLEDDMQDVARGLGLVLTARPVQESAVDVPTPTHMISVYGADRPGIVFRVSQLLAGRGVNITDLTSRVIGESGEPVYALMLEVVAPEDMDLADSLASLKEDLGVEVTVHPIDADLL